jgi:hypothetical protein
MKAKSIKENYRRNKAGFGKSMVWFLNNSCFFGGE